MVNKTNNNKLIRISENTENLLNECEKEFIKHNPLMKEIPLSKNKIIHEVCEYYLKN